MKNQKPKRTKGTIAFFTTIDNINFLQKVYNPMGFRLKKVEKYNTYYPINHFVMVYLAKQKKQKQEKKTSSCFQISKL